jgi:hypothetical protein
VRFVVVFHFVMVHIMIMVLAAIFGAFASHLFELIATVASLFAVFAVALNRVAKSFLCGVNALFATHASLVTVIGACWKCGSNQADDRQQCDTKNSDSTSHVFSLK